MTFESIFESDRLTVRALRESDFARFHEMQSNPRVMQYATGEAADESANRAEFDRCLERDRQGDENYRIWAITRQSDDAFVGTCALIREGDAHEIGYRLLESEWGRGYGGEITQALLRHCVATLQLDALVAYVDHRNTASVKILDRSILELVPGGDTSKCACDLRYEWRRAGGTT